MRRTSYLARMVSDGAGQPTRRSTRCGVICGPSGSTGSSTSIYASISNWIPHPHLRTFLDQRVTDGVIRRMIDKWLKAGVVEDGLLRHMTEGSPQGGVVSPCLSNVFLHYVLDEWFETEVKPRLHGESLLVRFADDAIMAFDNIVDAQRILAVLGKRLERFGLTLHPDKTRLVDFRPLMTESTRHPETDGTSFVFLGFTHVWGRSRKGKKMVRQITAKSRLARALAATSDWCRKHRHLPLRVQHRHLSSMMRGHFAYYGVGGNIRRLRGYAHQAVRIWKKWLSRRDRQSVVPWTRLNEILNRHPLPQPKISHRIRRRERISLVKNRMREIRTSGSVRDGVGNVPIYSARDRRSLEGVRKRDLKPFGAVQRVRRPPSRAQCGQPEASLAWAGGDVAREA